MAENRPKPTPTGPATISMRGIARRGGSSGWRRSASTVIATTAPITDRPTPTSTGGNEDSAGVVAGKVMLKQTTPIAPSASGAAFPLKTEVLLLSLMNDDSSQTSPQAGIERLVRSLPPGSRLPSYREL